MAKALAINGAKRVYIIGRRKEHLDKLAQEHPSIVPLVGDVSSKESMLKVTEEIQADTGFINVLIANAGIAQTAKEPDESSTVAEAQELLLDIASEKFNQILDINLISVYYTVMAFLTLLDAGNKKKNIPQRSQVMLTSSMVALNRESRGGIAYSLSKAALIQLAERLPKYLLPFDIRINTLAPGRTSLFLKKSLSSLLRQQLIMIWPLFRSIPICHECILHGRKRGHSRRISSEIHDPGWQVGITV